MIKGARIMGMKLILNLIKLLKSKDYGVGDDLPESLDYSKLESLDVYRSKRVMDILGSIDKKASVRKVDSSDKSS
jgi:hypothetical protein